MATTFSQGGAFLRTPRTSGPIANERGQSMVEAAISMGLVIIMLLGTVEFGRGFMISNSVTNAARVGARAAAVEPLSNRDDTGKIIDDSAIIASVRQEIAALVGEGVAQALSIEVAQSSDSVPLATVTVSGTVPYMFNLVGSSFTLNRSVSYRDQTL